MHIPEQVRSRLTLIRRVLLWTGMAFLLFLGLFSNPFGPDAKQAWAAVTACPGQLSIPASAEVLYLVYGVPNEYDLSLCQEPTAPVEVFNNVDASDPLTVSPPSLTFINADPQTVEVTVADDHPQDEPFTFEITHFATSDDPEFDYPQISAPTVTVYYSPPQAVDDYAGAPHGQSISIDVLDNDINRREPGGTLELPPGAIVTDPTHGTATVNNDDTIQYTPNEDYAGIDTFTYQVADTYGNTDIGTVYIVVAPPGTAGPPQVKPGNPVAESVLEFLSALGILKVTVPPLDGLPPNADVAVTFSGVTAPRGNVNQPPAPLANFSGIAFRLEIFVDGEPLDPADLSGPVTVELLLPDTLVEGLDGARILLVHWNGTNWTTNGISAPLTTSPTAEDQVPYSFSTTVFGEFAIFIERAVYVPFLEAN